MRANIKRAVSPPDAMRAIDLRGSPTFGAINLEDIKAPECFEIEQALIEQLDMPVMHDDQHGTAVIIGAGLLNALTFVPRDSPPSHFSAPVLYCCEALPIS